jgi:hypothetical protein
LIEIKLAGPLIFCLDFSTRGSIAVSINNAISTVSMLEKESLNDAIAL